MGRLDARLDQLAGDDSGRFSHVDWVGDGVLMLICGLLLLASLLLPWAREGTPPGMSYSPLHVRGMASVLETPFWTQPLAVGIFVTVLATLMIVWRPSRVLAALCALVPFAALVVIGDAKHGAGDAVGWHLLPGPGEFVATISAILLLPIGIAAAMVALLLVAVEKRRGARGADEPPVH